jgi:MFS superfamily sulfate permease-like transporter
MLVVNDSITMIDFHVVRDLWRLGREGKQDLVMWAVAFFGVLFLDLEVGMSAAIGLNAALLLYKQARPNYAVLRAKYRGRTLTCLVFDFRDTSFVCCLDVLVFRVEGPIVFSNVAYLVRMSSIA